MVTEKAGETLSLALAYVHECLLPPPCPTTRSIIFGFLLPNVNGAEEKKEEEEESSSPDQYMKWRPAAKPPSMS